jgi:peptidoglycan/xylan/chitin deacetylase (PgdA/CDA1 family)
MYHEVTGDAESPGYFGVTGATFARHLDLCIALGRGAESLEARLRHGSTSIGITFDDGHVGCYEHALPALLSRRMSATFFVVTDWVGRAGRLTWQQLREMSAAGMSIQSHTHTHPFLSELSARAVEEELRRSRGRIEDELGSAVTTLSLPNGDAPRGWARDDFARLGFDWVATSRWALNHPDETARTGSVHRITVRRATDEPRVSAMIRADVASLWFEGVRLGALHRIRELLGTSRYAAIRRRLLAGRGDG